MGAGFVITIIFLGALLGMFARQALSAAEEVEPQAEQHEHEAASAHFHAM